MIDPSECFAGLLSAAKPMSLVLPTSNDGNRFLIATHNGMPHAICLDELHQLGRFHSFPCNDDHNFWGGLHIPGIRIELDEASLNEAQGRFVPRGAMLRTEDRLELRVQLERHQNVSVAFIIVADGLPACAPNQSACFLKWQVVIGKGQDKRVLWQVDANSAS